MAIDVVFGFNASPGIAVYPWSSAGNFGAPYANPSPLPNSPNYHAEISPNGQDIISSTNVSPFMLAWPWTHGVGFGVKYANPGTLPGTTGHGVRFSPASNAVVKDRTSSPFIEAWPWTPGVGFGAKYANPGTTPAATSPFCTNFAPDGASVFLTYAFAIFGGSHVSIVSGWPWSSGGGFGSRYADQDTGGTIILANPYGSAMPLASDGIVVPSGGAFVGFHFNAGSGFGARYTNPSGMSTGNTFDAKFTTAGADVVATDDTGGGGGALRAWPWTSGSGFGVSYANAAGSSGGAPIAISTDNFVFRGGVNAAQVWKFTTGVGFGVVFPAGPVGTTPSLGISVYGTDTMPPWIPPSFGFNCAGVHWTAAEQSLYAMEALHVFNALTQYAKTRAQFVATNGAIFYDLTTAVPAQRAYTILDQQLVTLLEYALMEPPTPTVWTGSAMFTLAQLTNALQTRLDRFKWETGIALSRELTAVVIDANGRVPLNADVTQLRRVLWTPNGGASTPVARDDEWAMNQFAKAWPTPVVADTMHPLAYSVGVSPPLTVQLAPPPTVNGSLDVLVITQGATLNPAVGVLLGIPDDFAWVVYYGALADLLKEPGPANDPIRGQIADQLWDLGIAAAKRSGVVLSARINGVPVPINTVSDADSYSRQWQTGTGVPARVLLAGNNLLALSPIADAGGPYIVTLDLVQNIPLPVNLGDTFIAGGAALTQILMDYARFLALYKEGPSQAQEGTMYLQRFMTACGIETDFDQALSPNRDSLIGQTRQAERVVPRSQPTVDTTT